MRIGPPQAVKDHRKLLKLPLCCLECIAEDPAALEATVGPLAENWGYLMGGIRTEGC